MDARPTPQTRITTQPMTTVHDVIEAIESFAPLAVQDSFDNTGLAVGHPSAGIDGVIVCVDATLEVLDEAQAIGADMVVSHHPSIFNPLRHLTGSTYSEQVAERAIRAGIALYSAHTNLDAVPGGMSYRLAGLIGVENPVLLGSPRTGLPGHGYGVVGRLPRSEDATEFLKRVKLSLGTGAVRHSDIVAREVTRVALCTGAGGSQIGDAIAAGADIYLSADMRYNNFIDARGRITIADFGHFETEYCAIDLLYDIITKKLPNFAVYKSRHSRNPVNYLI